MIGTIEERKRIKNNDKKIRLQRKLKTLYGNLADKNFSKAHFSNFIFLFRNIEISLSKIIIKKISKLWYVLLSVFQQLTSNNSKKLREKNSANTPPNHSFKQVAKIVYTS